MIFRTNPAILKCMLVIIIILFVASGSKPLHATESEFPQVPASATAGGQYEPSQTDPDLVAPNQFGTANGYYALVANSYDGTVTVFSVATGTVVDTIRVGEDPGGGGANSSPGCIAVTPDNRWALVGYERTAANRLFILAIDKLADGIVNNEIVDVIDLGNTNPQEDNCIAVTPDGSRAYVIGGDLSSDIAVVDLNTVDDGIEDNEVSWPDNIDMYGDIVVITPDGGHALLSFGYSDTIPMLKIDPGSEYDNTVVAWVALSDRIDMTGLAIAPDGRRTYAVDGMYTDKLYVIDNDPTSPTYHTLIDEILMPLGDSPRQVIISPDNHRAYVSRYYSVAVVDVDPISSSYLSIVQTFNQTEPAQIWLRGMALTADGATLIVVNNHSRSVSIYDTVSGAEVHRVSVGGNPQGIALFRRPQLGPYISVVDEAGVPLADAEVYRNGDLIGISDGNGFVAAEGLAPGDELAALLKVHEQPSTRLGHESADGDEGWAYRTYVTSLIPPTENHGPLPLIADNGEEQALTVSRSSVLVLFNLVVGIEWDASAGYVAEIVSAMQSASDYLYDASDGQMALGKVTIVDQREGWREADIQIAAGNFVHPYAIVNGIFSEDRADVVRLGRYWDGQTGNEGGWHQPDGFRTITHELGHYALGIYDEYFRYGVLDPTFCPVPPSTLPGDDSSSASIMSYHYAATEFSALGVPGLWSDACTNTEQWRLNHESPWQTLARIYTAPTEELPAAERWEIVTPMDRGQALAGPEQLPAVLPDWPIIDDGEHDGDLAHSLQLTVYRPGDQPAANAIVMLQKQSGQMIGQGLTDPHGRLTVLGAEAGDILSAKIARTTLEGQQTVGQETEVAIHLEPSLSAAMIATHPSIQIIPLESSASNTSLLITVENLPTTATPTIAMTAPGDATGFTTVQLSPHEGGFAGTASFAPSRTGTGRIRYKFDEESGADMTYTNYRLQQIDNSVTSAVFSDDGNLTLQVEPESLAGNHALLAVTADRALPGPLPVDKKVVGEAYSLAATGAAWQLEGDAEALLRLHYDPSLIDDSINIESLAIYRWDFEEEAWGIMESQRDDEHFALVTTTSTLDTYVLLAETNGVSSARAKLYLPLVQKD